MWLIQYLKSMGDNFGIVIPQHLYRGAAPDGDDYDKLLRLDVDCIVNLIDGEQDKAKATAARFGIALAHFPMSDHDKPDAAEIEKILALLRQPLCYYVHCKGGRHRTGLVIACYRVRECGWSKQRAWDEAKKFGYYSFGGHKPLEDFFFNNFNGSII